MDMMVPADSKSKQQANYKTMKAFAATDFAWEILQLLPVKSLLRFKCVSKSWKALISDRKFISMHLNRYNNKINDKEKFFVHFLWDAKVAVGTMVRFCLGQIMANKLICSNDFSVVELLDADSPIHTMMFMIRFLCHCNGVLCVSSEGLNSNAFLYNPSTKESLRLPQSCLPPFAGEWLLPAVIAVGFGCDPKSQDYKVVRVVSYSSTYRVEVYTLGADSWREIGHNVASSFPDSTETILAPALFSTIYPNGARQLYWSQGHNVASFPYYYYTPNTLFGPLQAHYSSIYPPYPWHWYLSQGHNHNVASFPYYPLNELGPSQALYSNIYLNGACHWYWSQMDQIISFNLGSEEFEILPIGTILPETRSLSSVLVLNESLALFSYSEELRESEIWVMKEYGVKESWTKMFTIESLAVEEPLVFWRNDEEIVLFIRSPAQEDGVHRNIYGGKLFNLVSYNLWTQEIKPFDDYRVRKVGLYGRPKAFANFVDSLVSLKGG